MVGDFPAEVATMAPQATVELHRIPDCDHQFRGRRNGRIMSQAPLRAFAGLTPFPHDSAGLDLYD